MLDHFPLQVGMSKCGDLTVTNVLVNKIFRLSIEVILPSFKKKDICLSLNEWLVGLPSSSCLRVQQESKVGTERGQLICFIISDICCLS